MHDMQLALVVARLLHGSGSAIEKATVQRHLIEPLAEQAHALDRPWAEAVCAWMGGDAPGCLSALLSPASEATHIEGPASAMQLLPVLALLAPASANPQWTRAEVLTLLRRRCLSCSERLQAEAMPSLALQHEAIAQGCRGLLQDGGDAADAKRAARVCATALLATEQTGTSDTPATEAVKALQQGGLALDAGHLSRRLETLRRHLHHPSQAAGRPRPADASSLGGPLRQNSFDTQRSWYSTASSGRPLSAGSPHWRRHASRSATRTDTILGEGLVAFQVQGDAIHAVCVCPLVSPDAPGRPVVVATHRHGLLEGAAHSLPEVSCTT